MSFVWFSLVTLEVSILCIMIMPRTDGAQIVVGDGVNVSTCDFTALWNATEVASAAYDECEITFNCSDSVTIFVDYQLSLRGHVTVNGGNRVTLDGGGHFRLFQIKDWSSNVTIKNMVLRNGGGNPPRQLGKCPAEDSYCVQKNISDPVNKYDGGCIYQEPGTVMILDSVSFVNCSSVGIPVEDPLQHANDETFMGGAIYADYYTGLYINDCTFLNNTALQEGGAIYKLVHLFPTYPLGLVVTESLFQGNTALGKFDADNTFRKTGGGGAIFSESSMVICDCKFRYNTGVLGGAIRSYRSDLFVMDSIFVHNRATDQLNSTIVSSGGAIYAVDSSESCDQGRSTIQINSSQFISNEAHTTGAAISIRFHTWYQNLLILNTRFVGNRISSEVNISDARGVAISVSCPVIQIITVSGVQVGHSLVGEDEVSLESSVDFESDCFGDSVSTSGITAQKIRDRFPGLTEMDEDFDNNSLPYEYDESMSPSDKISECLSLEDMVTSLPVLPTCPPPPSVATSTEATDQTQHTTKTKTSAKKKFTTSRPKTSATRTSPKSEPKTSHLSTERTMTSTVTTAAVGRSTLSRLSLEFDSHSFWNGNSASMAMDGDGQSCYVSGIEVTSWWMMRLGEPLQITGLTINGSISGDLEVKFGDSYNPIGLPCLSSSANPTLWKQAVVPGPTMALPLVIDFPKPSTGTFLSIKTENFRATQMTICEVNLRY